MNKRIHDLNYYPSMSWKKLDSLSAKADDGSFVSLDARGVVVYRRPDSYYLSFGVELENGSLVLYVEKEFSLMDDGHVTNNRIPISKSGLYIDSIIAALKTIGYFTVKIKTIA